MTDILSERALINELEKQSAALGLILRGDAAHGLSGEAEKSEPSGGWAAARSPIACRAS